MKYFYDTNIFIYYLAEEFAVQSLFTESFLNQNKVIISPIVRIELLSFPEISLEEAEIIDDLLTQFEMVRISDEIENITIQLKRKHRLKLGDALIAASALHHSACLTTRNVKDFQSIADLELINPFDKGVA
jgi:predicted nucleic acid-binding protein